MLSMMWSVMVSVMVLLPVSDEPPDGVRAEVNPSAAGRWTAWSGRHLWMNMVAESSCEQTRFGPHPGERAAAGVSLIGAACNVAGQDRLNAPAGGARHGVSPISPMP